jgi:Probable cobalt transporter subunit (CbtA)
VAVSSRCLVGGLTAAGLPAEPPGPDIFSRTIQANVGIGVGMVFFGITMGALFAVVYAVCLGRVGNLRPRGLALLVAGGGFLGVYLVPFPQVSRQPAVDRACGHHQRSRWLYVLMVVCSLAFPGGAVWLGRRLAPRFGNWNATLLAAAAFVVLIGIVMAILPPPGHLAANVREYGVQPTETPLPLRDAAGTMLGRARSSGPLDPVRPRRSGRTGVRVPDGPAQVRPVILRICWAVRCSAERASSWSWTSIR